MRRTILIITVIAAAVMELIDTSIVNVALSHMSGNLGATIEDASWVITSYAIANVIIIPLTSFLSALLGRSNYYIGSVIAFTFFSFMCGQASNIWMLVIFRFLQGMGGGALLSISQTIVFEQYPKEKQNIASALFGVGVFVGPTIGPTLGGYITEHFSWPWIFYINVPIGILVTTVCFILLAEPKTKPTVAKIDWIGIALLAIGVSSLQTVLERGETEDWFATTYIIWLSVIAFFGILLFIWWEHTTDHPAVNLRVLKSRNLSIAAILTFVSGVGIYSSVFLTPVFVQRLLNFTPTQTGLLLLPGAVLAIGGLMVSARVLQKGVSPVVIIVTGMVGFILFTWQMSRLSIDSNGRDITTSLIWRGVGLALITVPLTTLAVSSLNPKDIPQGAALNNMMRQLGGSFGIAIVNTFLTYRNATHRTVLVSHITTDNPLAVARLNSYTQYFLAKGYNAYNAKQMALGVLDKVVTQQSNMMSFSDAFLLLTVIFITALPILFYSGKMKARVSKVSISDH